MRERLIGLRERRAMLLERAAAEREDLALWLARSDAIGGWIHRGAAFAAALRRRPWWVAGGVALLVAMRPRRALRWAVRSWSLWQLYRRGRALWRRFAPAIQHYGS